MSDVLRRFQELSGHVYVDGAFRQSEGTDGLDVIDPATEAVIGTITNVTPAEIDETVKRANEVQKSWSRWSALDRAKVLHKVADEMEKRTSELAEALTREMGKPYKESVDEVGWSVHSIRYSAEIARSEMGRVMGPAVEGQFHYTLKQPLGTAVLILPFNYPMVLLAWEAGAALATGNAVVVKPSEYTTITTMLFAEAFSPLPSGLFQVLSGAGEVGRRLVEHPDTHVVAFTGSVPVGRTVSSTCGGLMKRCLIENSGNDPFVIMPSARLDVAARAAAFSAFMNCGQICVSAERFYVHESIYDEFADKLVEQTKLIRVGNGLDKVDMGPMVSAKERNRYEAILERATADGVRTVVGGGRPKGLDRGWFVDATVLVDCEPGMSIFQQESFGPVAPLCRVKSFEEAIELANRSQYGLGANIYTRELSEGIHGAERLQAGMVWVNAPLLDNDAGPFGGVKLSGLGRQLGPEGLDTFRATKTVMIDPDCGSQDFWWFPYPADEMYPGD